ncbi:hypothetical protein J1614_004971 [Plenodomus biglobosus]|nr:hypothetical protein J1614_004971 [Plenodomus biglobosus]
MHNSRKGRDQRFVYNPICFSLRPSLTTTSTHLHTHSPTQLNHLNPYTATMQFTTLFLAAAASGLSVAQTAEPTDNGNWIISYESTFASNGFKSESIWGNFTSPSYGPPGSIRKCEYTVQPPSTEKVMSCDTGFKASYNGTHIIVQQDIELPVMQTVFGEGPIEVVTGVNGKSASGRAVIQATSAIA